MCGIVGYIGHRDSCPILIKGLKRLEYRGYDSAVVAMITKDDKTEKFKLHISKAKRKVADLEAQLHNKDESETLDIANTRWQTHGKPNRENAHPRVTYE